MSDPTLQPDVAPQVASPRAIAEAGTVDDASLNAVITDVLDAAWPSSSDAAHTEATPTTHASAAAATTTLAADIELNNADFANPDEPAAPSGNESESFDIIDQAVIDALEDIARAAPSPAPTAPAPIPSVTAASEATTDLDAGVQAALDSAQAAVDDLANELVAESAAESPVQPLTAASPTIESSAVDSIPSAAPAAASPPAGTAMAALPPVQTDEVASDAPAPEAARFADIDDEIEREAALIADDEFASPEQISRTTDRATAESTVAEPPQAAEIAPHEAAANSDTPTPESSPAPAPALAAAAATIASATPPPAAAAPTTPPASTPAVAAVHAQPEPKSRSAFNPRKLAALIALPVLVRLAAISKPVQHTLGWIALATMFNAGAVWTLVLVTGNGNGEAAAHTDPHAPAGGHAPASHAPKAADAHASAKAPAKAGHGAPAKDSHGAPKKDAHAPAKPAKKTDAHGAPKKAAGGH